MTANEKLPNHRSKFRAMAERDYSEFLKSGHAPEVAATMALATATWAVADQTRVLTHLQGERDDEDV